MKYNVILSSFFFLLSFNTALAAEMPLRMVSVTGTATEEISPDQAVLYGNVSSKADTLADAKKQNDTLVERVVAVAKQFEIPMEKVAAANVNISPQYRYNKATQQQELTGYQVSRQLTITMDKMELHERVLSALVENGIDQINGVRFDIKNREGRIDQLRVQAVKNAKARAEMLASAAGAKLGKVLSIQMQGAAQPPMPMMARSMMAADMAESSVAPSLPGEQELQESVSVTFELE